MIRLLLFILFLPSIVLSQDNTNALLQELDQTIQNIAHYSNQKDAKIVSFKKQFKSTTTDLQKHNISHQLYDEYRLYKSDSALVYARKNLIIATKLNDNKKINQANLDLAAIMGTLGMYKEAIDLLSKKLIVDTPELKGDYYSINRSIYGYMSDYASSKYEKNKYRTLVEKYRDSSLIYIKKPSAAYTINLSESLIEKGKYDEALRYLETPFQTIKKTDPNRAVFAYIISTIYQKKGDISQQKKWLILSAISDLQLSKKENISLRNLAFLLYEEGDINRAYLYIQRSLEDALFCNARLRTYEISKMLPIINGAYQQQNETNKKQLLVFLLCVSLLTIVLLLVMFQLFKQMKQLKTAQKELNQANQQLVDLNTALHSSNLALNETNNNLKETNMVKEIYIGRYMDQCSEYIAKLEGYRKKLNVMATAGKMNQLLEAVQSKKFIEQELTEFYTNFDSTFLQLFPNFIVQFELLLIDTELTERKDGELLNTELRIVALIRLGIKDSAKIATFLRYSVSTIYNYRSLLKNKAKGPREEFESKVLQIGSSKL
jgi:cell division protein FtsB